MRDVHEAITASHWRPHRWLPLAAAIAALSLVVSAIFVLNRPKPGPGTPTTPLPSNIVRASASPQPTPRPVGIHVLSPDELLDAIRAHRAGGRETQDVIADVSLDVARSPEPLHRKCQDPVGSCTVVGTLTGFDDVEGGVALRDDDPYRDLTFRDGRGPIALRLTARGPIEYLGRTDLLGTSRPISVDKLAEQRASITFGDVVAVDGWLHDVKSNCGPAMPEPVPPPFECVGALDVITPDATPPEHLAQVEITPGHLPVQPTAWNVFAGAGQGPDPQHAVYLVRRVVYEGDSCRDCRGWLAVGRWGGLEDDRRSVR